MSERHDARHDDLTSPLFGELAHVLDANLQIFEQPLRERSKLLPASVIETCRVLREKSETPRMVSICLIVRVRAGCDVFKNAARNEATILRDGKNCAKLT
jgi:hypothetical protein